MDKKASSKSGVIAWSVTVIILACIVAVEFYGRAREQAVPPEPPKNLPNVEVLTIKRKQYQEKLILPARITADSSGAVSPEMSGVLKKWLAAEGEKVNRGQVVAELDSDSLNATLDELKAKKHSASLAVDLAKLEVEQAKINEENAKKIEARLELEQKAAKAALDLAAGEFKRVETLTAKGVLTQADLDSAKNALVQAEVGVDRAKEGFAEAAIGVRAAKLGVERAQKNIEMTKASLVEVEAGMASINTTLEKLKLRSPISGVLEKHLVEEGEIVGAEMPAAFIYDLDYMRAVVEVPDRYIVFLNKENTAVNAYIAANAPGAKQGLSARVLLPGLPKLTGGKIGEFALDAEFARVAQASAPGSGAFEVELRFPNPAGALRHGIIASSEIVYLTYPNAVVVPMKAIKVTDEGPRAMVVETVDGKELAGARSVQPASVRDDELLILKGLSEGERLIVAGWKGLMPGEEVRVIIEDGAVLKKM